jgi:hypothetical protein
MATSIRCSKGHATVECIVPGNRSTPRQRSLQLSRSVESGCDIGGSTKITFRQEIAGGYLWSPKRNANDGRNPFYESMRAFSVAAPFADPIVSLPPYKFARDRCEMGRLFASSAKLMHPNHGKGEGLPFQCLEG